MIELGATLKSLSSTDGSRVNRCWQWGILMLSAAIAVDGFVSPQNRIGHVNQPLRSINHRDIDRGKSFRRAASDSNSKTVNWDDSGRGSRRRRARQADFPAFAYTALDGKNRPKQKAPVIMKFRDTSGTKERITNSASSYPRLDDHIPEWMHFLDFLIGTPLEAGLTRIYQSAAQTRLRTDRSYARKEPFEYNNMCVPPSLDDLSTPPVGPFDAFWISTPARLLSFSAAYLAFPFITRCLESFVSIPSAQLDDVTSKFGPGISILYGTFISLTLSILYNRLRTIQDNIGVECAYLVVMTRNLISLFREDRERAIEAGQCAADQIRTLVRSSRGAELMLLMYSDPYARMKELVDCYEAELFRRERGYDGRSSGLIANCRDTIKDLYRVRANRLSDESLALPPTHFLILYILTFLILLGYTASIIPTLDQSGGVPSSESCLLFAVLSTVYVLFYNFANDLNGPFDGVYQIRRSCAASHLLQLKYFIANHPLLRDEVDFEEAEEGANGVLIRSPGLGDIWFERDDLFVNADGDQIGEVRTNDSNLELK
jgi:Protein of unknown function (DUF4239)